MFKDFELQGQETFQKGFRVLCAGAGTGSGCVYLAEQLNTTDAKIVYLDFSIASMRIAQERAAVRGLTNIAWHHNSIENLPSLGLGQFDLISCTGVLHHLPDPQAGLNTLHASLKPGGGMALMLYTRTSRTGVYQLQQLMRFINAGVESRAAELQSLWPSLDSLLPAALLRRVPSMSAYWPRSIQPAAQRDQDIETYDLFCHKQDRAYSTPELLEFIQNTNLKFVFESQGTLAYRFDTSINGIVSHLDKKERMEVADLIQGDAKNHNFYVISEKV